MIEFVKPTTQFSTLKRACVTVNSPHNKQISLVGWLYSRLQSEPHCLPCTLSVQWLYAGSLLTDLQFQNVRYAVLT